MIYLDDYTPTSTGVRIHIAIATLRHPHESWWEMSHQIALSDAVYSALAARAAAAGTTPEALVEATMQEMLADEQAWDALTQQPGAHAFHMQLKAQAAASRKAGEVEAMGDDL